MVLSTESYRIYERTLLNLVTCTGTPALHEYSAMTVEEARGQPYSFRYCEYHNEEVHMYSYPADL